MPACVASPRRCAKVSKEVQPNTIESQGSRMPTNIMWFERLAYASLALGLVVCALDFQTLLQSGSVASVIGTACCRAGSRPR